MTYVHFICRGNVLRSLIAETYLKSLTLPDVDVISSGTNVNWDDPQERVFFTNTRSVLARHQIAQYAKATPNQLTQERIDSHHDIVVLMNQRVVDEARQLVEVPDTALCWNIVDIGEGHRTSAEDRLTYEEEIFREIADNIDALFSH